MENNESIIQDDNQNSTSFNDWCVSSNFREINNIDQLKVDNFNLRLKCYNLDRKLSNCRCSMSNNDESVSNADLNDKLNQYLDSQKDLKDKNSILAEENRNLKEQLNYLQLKESQIVDFESIKYKYEELEKVIAQQLPMGDSLIGLMKTNDELIKSNVALKHRIFQLEAKVTSVRKECAQSHNESRKSMSNLNQYQSKLIKEFNDSLELSKNISVGCFQCDALKVNYDHLYQIFLNEIENNEKLSSTLKTLTKSNLELERQIESLKSEPDVNKERAKRYKRMLQDSLLKVVKKDREKKEIREETKELIEYYMKQIGELNRKVISQLDLSKEDVVEQHNTMKTLSTMLFDLIRKFSLHEKSNLIDELRELMITKIIRNVESEYPKLKEKWSSIVNAMRVLYEHSTEQNASKNSSQEEHSSINLSGNFKQDVSMKSIITKFQELKELSNSVKETSNHFGESQRGMNLAHINMNPNSDSAIYSPQYKVNTNLRSTENIDHFETICLGNISLDATAYQSVTGDHSFFDVLASSGFENMLRKIEELGDIIHQYSDLVKKVKFHEESPEMIDKGCSVLVVEDDSIDDSQDLDLLHSESVEEENKSKDLSFLKTLYHREKEEFENLISEKIKVIENLNIELEEIKRKYKGNVSVLNSELEGVNLKYKLSETRIKELEGVIIKMTEQKEIDQNCITDLKSKIKELEEVIAVEENKRIEMEEIKLKLVDSVKRADLLENKLIQTKNQIIRSDAIIDNLKSSNSELNDKIGDLNSSNRSLINEKSKLQCDYNDCVASLANLTESLGIASENINSISLKVREIFVRFVKKGDIKDDIKDLENCETLDILDGLETYLCDLSIESQSVSDNDLDDCIKILESKENDYYKAGIERRQELDLISNDSNQPKSKITSLNDLTNISSLNAEISSQIMNTNLTHSHLLTGFKLTSLKDVVDNPDKVVLLLRSLFKTIEDLKRRLKKRYEENERMKRMISASHYSSTLCDTLTRRVDQLKVECASNNEDIEKVIKRSSLKQ